MSSTARPTTWLVTGANRGIGLELVRQLLASPSNLVVAACRTPAKATALEDLKKTAKGTLHIVQLDVSDFDNIRALPAQLEPILGTTGLDYLVSNAAIFVQDTPFTLDPEGLLSLVRTNVAGPALLAQVALPFLSAAPTKKVLHISSTAGSIASVVQMPPAYAANASYPISKAALNMLVYKQKVERPDLTVIALCPGWVQTDMGGSGASLTPEKSVSGIIKVITTATSEDSGKFLRYDGESVPW
ncbi:hypothetical protein TRAPUB_6149 [Trametes pubescens]|uniref:C-factor n=1 Tax=Trametes pubescens TaxID=154538 RepID=A0A1M2V6R8_TRAPU|nr:hypothetical protein TRAPUB_6149 [Trametes pubescens]